MRIQKYLAQCGVASRRKAEEYIAAGRVKINGKPAKIGDSIEPGRDKVLFDGKSVRAEKKLRYIMLHKPRGVVTTLSDEMNRKCVTDLLSGVRERVYPVGRLDRNSEGLLLLTNDGDFANRLTHPSSGVAKIYRVTLRPDITPEQIDLFFAGIELDGRMTAPVRVSVINRSENRVVVEMELREGRNRQIRRMCEAMELEVARLKRVSVGNLKLGMLPPGEWRDLTNAEVAGLRKKEK